MDMIRTAQYFTVVVPDEPGEAARALGKLYEAGVDLLTQTFTTAAIESPPIPEGVVRDGGVKLLAFSAFPRDGGAQLDFVPSAPIAFKTAAQEANLKVKGPKLCFLAEGDDRPGGRAALMKKLADAKIDLAALHAVSSGTGRYGAVFWVKPHDVKKAIQALGLEEPAHDAVVIEST